MKTIVCFLLLLAGTASAQNISSTTKPQSGSDATVSQRSETKEIDTNSPRTVLGWLLTDNHRYYDKAPLWVPLAKITISNAALHGIDRFVFNYDWSHISWKSWRHNLDTGWVWDDDRFGENFFLHPYTGAGYFMDARSLGYSFWESFPFAVFGSAMWEYFGETTPPSKNDIVNTPVNGTFLGEVAYRLSSNILDDRATGSDRFWREFAGGLMSPSRLISRLMTGKLWEVSNDPTLEKEPMDARLSVGSHFVNNATDFASGPVKFSANLMVDYGDPFELRDRAPFDHFKMWADVSNAYGRKYLDNITGYGLLWGGNARFGPVQSLLGVFQHFDYWDNNTFELGDVAFGVGAVTRLPITSAHNLYSNIHASFIPMAGNSTAYGPIDTTQTRDYNFGDGLQLMTETGISLFDQHVDLSGVAYYIYFHSYNGQPGDNSIVIVKPRIGINIMDNLGIGFEHQLYLSDRTSPTLAGISLKRTEQRLFVQWNWNDFPHGQ